MTNYLNDVYVHSFHLTSNHRIRKLIFKRSPLINNVDVKEDLYSIIMLSGNLISA